MEYSAASQRSSRHSWQKVTKVPKVNSYFWIIKILTTAMGEATSDYLVSHMNPIIGVGIGFIFFLLVLTIQISVKKYITWTYWLAAVGVSVFGTMAADVLHVQFHVPYIVSSSFYLVVLLVIFYFWYKSEGTLSFHSIYTRKRELFYWATVLATFALGTATGDLTATTFHLGYLTSGVLFAVVFVIPRLAYFIFKINEVFAFWFAYIITRPLGASFADWVSKSPSIGGLGKGDGPVALALSLVIFILVAFLAFTGKDLQYNA